MQHGLLGSAEHFTSNKDLSPAFILAQAGFDVWLGNSRGTKYSRSHETLDPDFDQKFWEFSWGQMAEHDLPASINYVRQISKANKITYIGHS